MTTRRNSIGERYVYDENDNLLAVHGKFCTGCSATSGNCGRLTDKMLPVFKRLYPAIPCDWCGTEAVHLYAVTFDGERICSRCKPYAWAAVVRPETYEANRAIATKRSRTR